MRTTLMPTTEEIMEKLFELSAKANGSIELLAELVADALGVTRPNGTAPAYIIRLAVAVATNDDEVLI